MSMQDECKVLMCKISAKLLDSMPLETLDIQLGDSSNWTLSIKHKFN